MIGFGKRSRQIVSSVAFCALLSCRLTHQSSKAGEAHVLAPETAQETTVSPSPGAITLTKSNAEPPQAATASDRTALGRNVAFINADGDAGNCVPVQPSGCTVGTAFQQQIVSLIVSKWGPVNGEGAVRVARCESGHGGTTASNGQYLGLFQMGSNERARFGYGPCAEQQIAGAYAYYSQSGWGPWACKP